MEVILIVFNLVEHLLNSMISLQSHPQVPGSSITVRILDQEQDRLHILEVGTGAWRILLQDVR